MSFFPQIPTKVIISGDTEVSRSLIGLGQKYLSDLNTFAGFQDLPTCSKTHRLDDGSIIKVNISYGLTTIEIHVPVAGEKGKKSSFFICPCYPCFVLGVITKILPDRELSEEEKLTIRYSYEVKCCVGRSDDKDSLYVEIDVQPESCGWEKYYVDEYVWITLKENKFTSTNERPECLYEYIIKTLKKQVEQREAGEEVDELELAIAPIYVSNKIDTSEEKWN